MTAETILQPVRERGWRNGFNNLLDKECSLWFGSRAWWRRLVTWLFITNTMPLLIGLQARSDPSSLGDISQVMPTLFFVVGGMAIAGGAVVLSQDAVIGERQSGTAAWVLSKPASRTAFILSKFIANTLGLWTIALLAQAAVFYAQYALWAGQTLPLGTSLAAIGLLAANSVFYVALTIMLGTIYSNRGPVIGIGLGFMFVGQVMTRWAPKSGLVTPWKLGEIAAGLFPSTQTGPGASLPEPFLPLAFTLAWTVLFMAVALRLFSRQEL
ncbi:MAG TPA: ABC transporter permease subunit [Bacillota bacterium]|jgi:ABC-2 type transport system permease protein